MINHWETQKYFCLHCGISLRNYLCDKCGRMARSTGRKTVNPGAKGKNKAKKRRKFAQQMRCDIVNRNPVNGTSFYSGWRHPREPYRPTRVYIRSCGLHKDDNYRMVDANTMKCPICDVVVWKAKGLY